MGRSKTIQSYRAPACAAGAVFGDRRVSRNIGRRGPGRSYESAAAGTRFPGVFLRMIARRRAFVPNNFCLSTCRKFERKCAESGTSPLERALGEPRVSRRSCGRRFCNRVLAHETRGPPPFDTKIPRPGRMPAPRWRMVTCRSAKTEAEARQLRTGCLPMLRNQSAVGYRRVYRFPVSDIKLFQVGPKEVQEIPAQSVAIEKSLQSLIEKHLHLEAFLSVRLLASEYSTGKTHGGRIDTLGIDENGSPVIIEYKRALNENVINQGLFYLDWLLDHKGEFTLIVQKQLGQEIADAIEWSGPRLLCIAGDFTKYDEHAVQQINRNIELIRYKRYGDSLLLLELVNATTGDPIDENSKDPFVKPRIIYKGFAELLAQASTELRDRYEALRAFLTALGDDVQSKQLKYYIAFRRLKNFACVEVHPQSGQILAYVKVDPASVALEAGFTKDVTSIGHYGTGDLEIRIKSDAELEKARSLLLKSYENS